MLARAAVAPLLSLNPTPPHAASSPRRDAPSTTPMPPTAAGGGGVKEVVGEVGSPAARPAVGGGGGSACPKPYPSPRCAPASPRRKASSATTKPPPPLGSTAARCSRSSETPCFESGGRPERASTRRAPKHSGEANPHCRVNWVSITHYQPFIRTDNVFLPDMPNQPDLFVSGRAGDCISVVLNSL